MPPFEVQNYSGFGDLGPTPADLKALRMQERLTMALSDLTADQRELGNSITRVLEAYGIDHQVIFAVNAAVVVANIHFKGKPAPEIYAVALPYSLKGDEAVSAAIQMPLKAHINQPSSDTMARFMASLTETPQEKPKRKGK